MLTSLGGLLIFLLIFPCSTDSLYSGIVVMGPQTHRHKQPTRNHFGWIRQSEIGFRKWKHTSFSREAEKVLFPPTLGMNKKGTLWSPSEERINQPIHLLSVWLQINPNFRNSVHEFLIHHPSYYLHINFTGQKMFYKYFLMNTLLALFCLDWYVPYQIFWVHNTIFVIVKQLFFF